MRLRHLCLLLITVFTFSHQFLTAQNGSKFVYFSPDSLAGFDELTPKALALQEGVFGERYIEFINNQKRAYINTKYNLWEKEDNGQFPNTSYLSNSRNIGGGSVINATPCVNEGFETGTLSGWTASTGINTSSQVYPSTPTSISQGSLINVVTTPFTDPFVGTIPNSPLGGSMVAKINNSVTNAVVVKLSQTFPVTLTNYLYDFAYFAVMENASNPHNCNQTPYMAVRIRNFTGTLQACPNFSIVAPSTPSGCPGIGPTSWQLYTVGSQTVRGSNGWQKFSIDLTPYMGQNVTVEIIVADCSLTGHFGYAYFDSNCNTMNATVNGTSYSMPTATTNVQGSCGNTATLTAPSGLNPYSWNGPTGSGITSNTNQTIFTNVAGNYTLNMSPTGICNPPISKILRLNFPPATTVTANPATICVGGASTLSASGASSYTWSNGSLFATTIVSPTVTTIYTVAVQTGSCLGSRTIQVTVIPTPTVAILNSNPTICSGGSSTLTASGALSYVWLPGGSTNTSIVVSPGITTVYTLTGSNGLCVDTETTAVTVSSVASATILPINPASGTICAGSSIQVGAFGATSFTWYPTNPQVIGSLVNLTPSVTTQFTAVGGAGSCTNSAMITVTVDQGPSIVPTSSPTLICPLNSATLSATATGAVGSLTWMPSGTQASSIQITPSVTTNYTVLGKNANGCVRSVTVNQLVAPDPTITIVPTTPTVCIGGAVMLSASGGSSYTWSPGGPNTNTKVVSPLVTSVYTVAVSNGTCTTTKTTTVTVVPLPTVSIATSNTAVCLGNSATLTASGASTYTWMPVNLTSNPITVTPSVTTTYTLTGDQGGCTNTATRTIVVNPRPVVSVASTPTSVCPGFCSTLTPSGALTYTYLNGGPTVCPLVTTTYSVTGTNNFGCTSVNPGTVSVVIKPIPAISIAASSLSICTGSSATLTASGGTAYVWNTGATTNAIIVSPVATTNYTVVGTSSLGCTGTQTIQITVVPNPTVTVSASPASVCSGSCSILTAANASSYSWLPGGMTGATVSVCPLINTTYTVTGTTAGCSNTKTVAVTVNPAPTMTALATPTAICPGGSSTLTATGTAISYNWNPGGLTGSPVTVTPSVATIYTVTGTSAIGCVTTRTVSVTVSPVPSITITASSFTVCAGNTVGLTGSGASTYTWSTGSNLASITVTPMVTTTYTLNGTNATGCAGQRTITINVTPLPNITTTSNPTAICAGASATLTASGGSTYSWSTGSNSNPIVVTPTITTTYSVIGNLSGCVNMATVTVSVTAPPLLAAIVPSPSPVCPGISSTLSTSGASTYTWLPVNLSGNSIVVTPTITSSYTVIGANAAGCTSTRTVTVIVYPSPTVNVSANNATICSGASAVLTATGANSYVWNPGGLTANPLTVSPMVTTIYSVTGTNSLGCSSTKTIQIVVVPTPTITSSGNPTVICRGQSATLTATGGFFYNWSNGGAGASIVVSPTVNTTYTVIGSNNTCTGQAVVSVSVNVPPTVFAISTPTAICATKIATLSAGGATTYTWLPGPLTGANVTVSPASNTTYTVSGTSNNCTGSATAALVINPNPTITITPALLAVCAGQSDSLVASGASSYVWQPGSQTGSVLTISPFSTTTYSVIGTLGTCTSQATRIVTVNPLPVLSAGATPATICMGASSTLTVSGASTYIWSPGNMTGSSAVVSPSSSTVYMVTGTSAQGCTSSQTVAVTVSPNFTFNASAASASVCPGQCTTLNASGASSYIWQPGTLSGPSVTVCPNSATVYTVTGTNSSGCTSTRTVNVGISNLPVIGIASGPIPSTICAGQTSTLMMVFPIVNSYTWFPGNFSSQATVSPVSTTVYTVVATLGTCTASATRTLFVLPGPTITVGANPANICIGQTATLTASGASSFAWLPMLTTGNTVTVNPTSTSVYTVVGANTFSCFNSATVSVNVNPLPVVQISSSSSLICSGTSATLTGSGATNYSWAPGGSTSANIVVTPASTTIYTLTGTTGPGCSNTGTFALFVNSTPTLTAAASTPTVCAGFTVDLSASGGTSYNWQPGGFTGSPVNVTVAATTVYSVTSTNNGCTGSAQVSVTAIPLPTITAGTNPVSVCSGNSMTLTASGAATYTWLPNFQTGASIVVTPLITTDYTVVGQAASGCPNYAIVTASVLPNPVVTAASSSTGICTGGSATLTATGASNYTWQPGNLPGSSVVVNPVSATVYTVYGDNGGCAGIATLTLNVNPLPVVTAQALPASLCQGGTVALTASGAVNYTWTPSGLTGASVTDTPLTSTIYTVTGEDANGCMNFASVAVTVNPLPVILASANPGSICEGTSVSLNAAGANTYTWNPGNLSGAAVNDSPLITTTYTVTGTDLNGCEGNAQVLVTVVPNPTISVSPLNSSVCAGSSATLTASGATSYTWLPSNTIGSVTVESPVVNTTYTVTGDNAGICFSSFTVDVFVNPLPANVTASATGTITCSSPSIDLLGSSTDTNVGYSWSGPLSFTSNVQNPTGVTVWGVFTLSVQDNLTGCIATATVNVPTDNSIPLVNATTSGSITCAAASVTLNAVHTTTNPGYTWIGPGAFTSTLQTFTVSTPGDYTVVVTDLTSTCASSAIVSVGIHTAVVTTATISPATCSAGISNNDGTILVSNFGAVDKFDLVSGSTYTGSATYATAVVIPTTGIITSNLANPTATVAYTLRIFDAQGCTQDYTLLLVPTDCSVKSLGIAKSVSTPTVNEDGSYNVAFKVTVKNYDTTPLSNIELEENLSATFVSPATFSLVSAPVIISAGSSLTINQAFDGLNQVNLLNSGGSSIAGGVTDTINFTVRVVTNSFFGPYLNTIKGVALNTNSIVISDSSNTGSDPDPDNDGKPTNNNTPTSVTFEPNIFFGLTKVGAFQKMDDNSFDVTYTITVHNLGNDTLRDITVKDSLLGKTIRLPATYSIRSGPVTTGSLTANTLFNGSSDINLLTPSASKMPPGFVSTISFVMNVKADTVSVLRNSAFGRANKASASLTPVFVSDTSNAGTDPDSNNNNIWNEAADNVPTVLILPTNHTLFIPQGFSPNGDGINDYFVIKGLPETGENSITIYNRWGNRVYQHDNYHNMWEGYPNIAGTMGKDRLPQGTYYYVLDLKGSGIKPIAGFIVIQY